jgi:hypothetical protein
MIDHLVDRPRFWPVILVVVRVVPLTARTRYALLLCGLVKFAIRSCACRSKPYRPCAGPLPRGAERGRIGA